MRKFIFILLLFISCNPPSTEPAETIKGKVVSVADGDTMTILTDSKERIKVRLYGIDAPEKGQDFSSKARTYLNDLCYGKTVKVKKKGIDQYDRVLGIVYLDELNLNREMVKEGLAWYYNHYVEDPVLEELEKTARQQKLNIWSLKSPTPPYEYRKKQRSERSDREARN